MGGRDTNDLSITIRDGIEYLEIKNARYINAASAVKFSDLGDTIVISAEALWVDVDSGIGGRTIGITTPTTGAWFVYDDKMNCIATSLEAELRTTIILPENGRLAFAGEPGAEFVISGR